MKILKYILRVTDTVEVEMPVDSEILCVQTQDGTPCIWAKVYPEAIKETRTFHIRGTGHTLQGNEGNYIGTFQLGGGAFVGHLFEHNPT